MNILVIATTPIGYDGITSVIINNYVNMDKTNLNFEFIFPNLPPKHIVDIFEKDSVKIHVVSGRTQDTIRYVREINKIMKNKKYDLVHVHGNSNTLAIELFLAMINGIKVRIPHSHNTVTKFNKVHKILKVPFNALYTDALACGTDAGKWLYKDREFTVIENGIDADLYKYNENSRSKIRKEIGIKSKDRVIGHVGHFTYQKNQEFLINMFIDHPLMRERYKLLLIGDGPQRKELEQKVIEHDLTNVVIFTGKRTDVNALYSAFDILIMPSRYEGLPLTLVEAQSADLKCFVSENITKEVNITDSIEFFDLEETSESLVLKLDEYFYEQHNRSMHGKYQMIYNSKFNIIKSAEKLKIFYIDSMNRRVRKH